MPFVAGVDPCRGGWMVVVVEFDTQVEREELLLLPSFSMLGRLSPAPSFITANLPMGLLDEVTQGGRPCDRLARRLLGPRRGGSILSPPTRPALLCTSFDQAGQYRLNRRSFALIPRIKEVDQLINTGLQTRIREGHPEMSYFIMDGLSPVEVKRRSAPGRQARKKLLDRTFYQVGEGLSQHSGGDADADDVLDAYAMAWTAIRVFRGEAGCLPEDPPSDSRGLKMALWY